MLRQFGILIICILFSTTGSSIESNSSSTFVKLNIDGGHNREEVQLAEIEFYDNQTRLDVEIVGYSNEYHDKRWSHKKIIDRNESTTWANGDSHDGKFPHWFIFKFKNGEQHQFNRVRIYTGTQSNYKYRLSAFSTYISDDKTNWIPSISGALIRNEKIHGKNSL